MLGAVTMAMARAMADDPNVVVIGEDVGVNGGVFRATEGLLDRFGEDRVMDTPFAETVLAGMAIGLAAQGFRPVAEFQFLGFIYPALDQVINHAGRLRNRTRGRLTCPLVFRAPMGAGIHAPEHHSESTEALFAHIPGIRVVIPSSPGRAYGLLLSAISDPDPVMFFEPTRLYRAQKEEVEDNGQGLPLDVCFTLREGKDVTLVSWGASIRDTLAAANALAAEGISAEVTDQPLVSVETDKAVVEVPSPYSGTVVALHAKAGDIVPIGKPICDFEEAGAQEDKGTVVGSVPQQETAAALEVSSEPAPHAAVKAIPAVRALARKLGVDLIGVDATGPGGSITADDVKRYAGAMSDAGPPQALHGVRRAMAQKMEQSHAEIVPASVYDEADVESWLDGGDVTVRLIRAIVAGCKVSPILNAWYNGKDKAVRVIEKMDVGMAINTDDGLFVAVMRDVSRRDDADLRRGLNNLKQAVEQRQIPLEEMRGATITLSNFGVSGAGRFANLVVVPPQVAIVGAGTIRPH